MAFPPLNDPIREQLDRRANVGRWQIVRVTFDTADADVVIRHNLPTADPEQISYQPLNMTGPAQIYHDGSATRVRWGNGFVRLRASVAPVVSDILLQVVSAPVGTTKLPMGAATIPGINADTLDGLDSTAFGRSNASYWTSTAEPQLSSEVDIGALTTGLLKISVSGGTATPSTAVAGTDYATPGSVPSALDDLSDVTITTPADTEVLTYNGSAWVNAAASGGGARSIVCAIDGGGSAITTGVKADVYVPYACTITAVTMLADQSGSIVVDVWKDTYANFPPTVADTITASAKPTISAASKSQDTTLTGWTTSISAGDTLRFNVDSITTITRLHLALTVTL